LVKSGKKDPVERTDDPVRMYLRDMSSVLSRAGEVAIAKRIEAGRGVMLAGLCDSPLTFAAFAIWRDALNEGKIYLRDIVDLEATHADPEAKAMPAPAIGPDRALIIGATEPGRLPQMAAPAGALTAPSKPADDTAAGEEMGGGATINENDLDDEDDEDDEENWLSVAAIEAEAKPKVIETLADIAGKYKRLRRLQDRDTRVQSRTMSLSPAQERKCGRLTK
jgi:RNA polymerase primary sigma factor